MNNYWNSNVGDGIWANEFGNEFLTNGMERKITIYKLKPILL